MSWTDERVELLKKMWIEGQSASQIAKELGGVTRNAVIGKVHRLGLSNRNGTELDAAPVADAAPEPAPVLAQPEPEAPAPAPAAAAAPVVQIAQVRAERARAQAVPEPEADLPEEEPELDAAPASYMPRPIIPAGQPLPPQPSTDEIDPEALAKVHEVEKTSRRLTLMELTERTCKWPIGDPATQDFWFCGLPTKAGKPYCEAHVAVAFQPMSSRRDRRR